jgi:hypothetical protein
MQKEHSRFGSGGASVFPFVAARREGPTVNVEAVVKQIEIIGGR